MTQRIEIRIQKLEAARRPQTGELPCVMHWPDDPDRQRALAADIVEREACGQTCIIVRDDENPLAALVECFV